MSSRSVTWDERVLDALERAKQLSREHFDAVSTTAVLLFQPAKQSKKRLARTASACGWDQHVMEETVLAIAKIFMDAAKTELSAQQFLASMQAMGLPNEHADALAQLYAAHADTIKQSVSRDTGSSIARYQQLDWRIDLEVGSRFVRNKPQPIVTLRLDTLVQPRAADVPTRQSTCVRVGYESLRNVQRQLEAALREVDATHASRIQRYLR